MSKGIDSKDNSKQTQQEKEELEKNQKKERQCVSPETEAIYAILRD